MTRDEMFELAREAGLTVGQHWNKKNMTTAFMCDFAALLEDRFERDHADMLLIERTNGYEAGKKESRIKLAAWMLQYGYATGHGDTIEQLCDALGTEIVDGTECEVETEREACAKLADDVGDRDCNNHAYDAAAAIRARGQL